MKQMTVGLDIFMKIFYRLEETTPKLLVLLFPGTSEKGYLTCVLVTECCRVGMGTETSWLASSVH